MANIKQIAALAGVSVATVSRVLNRHPYVAEAKRAAVLAAIERLQYVPNLNAVHLIKGKTSMAAVILPHLHNPYISAPVEGIMAAAGPCSYRIVLCQTNYDSAEEIRMMDMLKHKQVDGIIIISRTSDWEQLVPYTSYGPIVVCEDAGENPVSCAYVDHYESFSLGLSTLISKGHRLIGYCVGRRHSVTTQLRRKALEDAMRSLGASICEEWLFHDALSMEAGAAVVHKLAAMRRRPTALLTATHQTAAGVILAARKQGLRIPDDLAVIGCDNHPIAELLDISSVEQSNKDLGSVAFEMLHRYISAGTYEAEKRRLPVRLVERATV